MDYPYLTLFLVDVLMRPVLESLGVVAAALMMGVVIVMINNRFFDH